MNMATYRNLAHRPARPALNRGRVQVACRRALLALGRAGSTSEVIAWTCARWSPAEKEGSKAEDGIWFRRRQKRFQLCFARNSSRWTSRAATHSLKREPRPGFPTGGVSEAPPSRFPSCLRSAILAARHAASDSLRIVSAVRSVVFAISLVPCMRVCPNSLVWSAST